MGSDSFEEMMNMGNIDDERRIDSTAVAAAKRRRKGSGSGEKPKQPQRGLGVAQLEEIRMLRFAPYAHFHSYPILSQADDMKMQITTVSSFSQSPSSAFHHSFLGMGENEGGSIMYGDSQPSIFMRWEPSDTLLETIHFGQPNMTGRLFNPYLQGSMHKNMNIKYWSDSIGSSNCQNYESGDTEDLDLELRLSINQLPTIK